MDIVIIVVLGLIFCLSSQRGVDSIDVLMEEQATSMQLETKLNDTFTQEEHAFEVIAHGLNFC